MIRNYFYLIVGILSILFSFTHAFSGHAALLPVIDSAEFDPNIKTTIFYVWHIISVENLIFGISFLVMSVTRDLSKVKFAAWMIIAVMIARWCVIFGATLIKNRDAIAGTLVDSIAIVIFVVLIILGARKKDAVARSAMLDSGT